eukprot:3812675-Pleurochrysis_carterae.AAC.1
MLCGSGTIRRAICSLADDGVVRARRVVAESLAVSRREVHQHLVIGNYLGRFWGWRAERALVEEDAADSRRSR